MLKSEKTKSLNSIVNWFIGHHLANNNSEIQFKMRLLVMVSLCLNVLILTLWYPLSTQSANQSAFPLFVVLLSSITVLFTLKFGRSYLLSALIIPMMALFLIPYSAFEIGYLNSPPTRWIPLLPMVASFFLGIRFGIIFCFMTIGLIVMMSLNLPHANISADGSVFPINLLFETSDLIGESIFVTILGVVIEIKRIKQFEVITKTKDLLKETNRIAKIGGWTYKLNNKKLIWSEEAFLLHDLPAGNEITLAKALSFYSQKDKYQIFRSLIQFKCGRASESEAKRA